MWYNTYVYEKMGCLSVKLRVFFIYCGFWLAFAIVFAVMFVLLFAAAAGVPFGVMLVIFGTAASVFKEDLIITELAPRFMLFGGLAMIFGTAACGLIAVKLGYFISRRFLWIKRRCDRLRDLDKASQNDLENDEENDIDISQAD